MLRFGLGQVSDPSSTSTIVPVALDDYVPRQAVFRYAESQKWSVRDALLRNFEENYSSTNPSSNGVSFETVVAGAIASYHGKVLDPFQSAAQPPGTHVPPPTSSPPTHTGKPAV